MVWVALFIGVGMVTFLLALPIAVSQNRRWAHLLWWWVALLAAAAIGLVIDLAVNPGLFARMF